MIRVAALLMKDPRAVEGYDPRALLNHPPPVQRQVTPGPREAVVPAGVEPRAGHQQLNEGGPDAGTR